MSEKRLVKGDKKIAGVCSGIANYLGVDVTLTRLAYAFLTVFTAGFPGVLLYICGMLLMPNE